MTAKRKNNFMVCRDQRHRICLRVNKTYKITKFIPMDATGFKVYETSTNSFNIRFELMPDYPVEQICQLYLKYCLAIGGSAEVLDYLKQVITVTKKDYKIASAKLFVQEETAKKKEVKKKVVKSKGVK